MGTVFTDTWFPTIAAARRRTRSIRPVMLRRGLALFLMALAVAAGGGLALLTTPVPTASALCATPAIEGDWHNVNTNTRSITRAVIRMVDCGDVIRCDEDGNCTGGETTFSGHLFGKCRPTDCDWGTVYGPQRSDGWIRVTYDFGYKTSYVWMKTYTYPGLTYLRVYVDNRFAPGDGRTNYTTDEWFLK
ncbi:MAG TPA: hypothetical protein VM450_04200 [Thermomicrobiales bacterium]|nr:hypothetical protein [Thermomicrobiales bacterium]